jgi:NADH pyrophosphatase NudC (nudix superfamily)
MDYDYCPICASDLDTKVIDERERQMCSNDDCEFIYYDNPTPVVAAVVQRADEVILIRNKGWPESWYGLVSGFLEKSEHPEEGVLREIAEEIGADGTLVDFIGHYPFEQMNQIIIAYHVTIEGEVSPGDEIADIKAVPIDKLKPWEFGTGPAVADWLDAHRDSESD